MARQSRHCQEIWEVIYVLILFDILKLGGVIYLNTIVSVFFGQI